MSQWHYLKVLWCYAQRKAVTFGQLAQFKLPTQGTRWRQRFAEENPYFRLDQPLTPRIAASSASTALSG